MGKNVNIVTVLKKGGDFHVSDVVLLAKHLVRYATSFDVTVYCLTDISTIQFQQHGINFIPVTTFERGWWAKLEMFNPNLEYLRPFLYMDLDTAIIGDYTELIPDDEKKMAALSDFYVPSKTASAIMWIPKNSKKVQTVWKTWDAKKKGIINKYRGDQDFIFDVTPADIMYQTITSTITSFKPDRMWLKIRPKGKSVVCFHGIPRIPEAAKTIQWVKQYKEELI